MDTKRVNAIIPLAILQTVRQLDQRVPEGLEEYRRLGNSTTVAAEIERYRKLVRGGADVAAEEVAQLFRLIGRRPDAGLVFSDAGRRAANEAADGLSVASRCALRVAPSFLSRRLGLASATRIAVDVFGVNMVVDEHDGIVADADLPSAHGIPERGGCGFFGAALAELLRLLTGFDGAMVHAACRTRGDGACRWHTGKNSRW